MICDDIQRANVVGILNQNKMKFFENCNDEVLESIRQWDYGVLILNPQQGRGTDTRF